MRPSTFLHTLSLKITSTKRPTASQATIAPWPPAQTPFDQPDALRLKSRPHSSASCLSDALTLAAATQTKALQSIKSAHRPIDRATIEAYLDVNVYLLDACNGVRRQIEAIRSHAASLDTAIHRLQCGGAVAACRAIAELSPLEGAAELKERARSLRRVGERGFCSRGVDDEVVEIREALDGSRAVAVLAVGAVGAALWPRNLVASVGEKRVKEFHWRRKKGTEVMEELRVAEAAAQRLVLAVKERGRWDEEEVRRAVEELRRRRGELEEGVGHLEEKIRELYRRLVDVRVFLLGVLSRTQAEPPLFPHHVSRIRKHEC